MTAYVALLRAVNVGGRGKVAMADLRALATDLGLANARTLLNSGNLVFGADGTADKIAARLAAETTERLGLTTDFLVRSAQEWRAAIAANPFATAATDDPGHLLLMPLKDASTAMRSDATASKRPLTTICGV
ncbi:MAG: DUF1697 domain-containing protein [Alphaproteobacteria bacterium]|nr:DUF1697 domain-containing protein [Alphaproteobacteria bacterium]